MNEGLLALILILGTIGAVIWAVMYRDLIWPTSPNSPRRPAGRVRSRVLRPGRAAPAAPRQRLALVETRAKSTATVSEPVSGVATLENDAEMIALRTLAKLIAANQITETAALQTVFAVRAGSSKRYKEVQAKLKIAQAELESAAELAG